MDHRYARFGDDTALYRFVSSIEDRGAFPAMFTPEIVKNEPMFFNSDLAFCRNNGGPVTRAFLECLPEDWRSCAPVVDSRVHMLMAGWYPAIPGFHHDDVPRSTPTGQPNYETLDYRAEHLTGLVGGDIAPTMFAVGAHALPRVKDGVIYRAWHPLVEEQLRRGELRTVPCPSGRMIQFDWQTMHTATRATSLGWRWFIRLSRKTDRQNAITNEIRRQVQVYLEHPMDGW